MGRRCCCVDKFGVLLLVLTVFGWIVTLKSAGGVICLDMVEIFLTSFDKKEVV